MIHQTGAIISKEDEWEKNYRKNSKMHISKKVTNTREF